MELNSEAQQFLQTMCENKNFIQISYKDEEKIFIDQMENIEARSISIGDLFTTLYRASSALTCKETREEWVRGRVIMMLEGDVKDNSSITTENQ